MQDQAVAILPLRHAKPEAIIPELERIFASRQGSVGADLVQFIPMQRLRAILVVSPRRNVIEDARVWVQRLDTENPDLNANVQVYRVKYRDARMLAQLLNGLFSGAGGGAAAETTSDQIEPGSDAVTTEGMTSGFNQNQPDGATQDLSNQDLIAGGPEEQQQPVDPVIVGTPTPDTAVAGDTIRIQADVANNSLVIYANLEKRQEILRALERIDVPQLQVAIHVTMAEIRLTDELRFGVQYFLRASRFGLGDNGAATLFHGLTTAIAQTAPGFNFVIGSLANPDAIIDAFDSITDVQVLSSPSLVVVENETARFQVGDQIPIVTRTVTQTQDLDTVSNEVEYRDTGIILNIKPRIAENGVVSLEIGQEISNVASGGSSLTPVISTRTIKSSISVNDGQTVLLGGLIAEQGLRERAGIPGLHRVRGLGALFGRRNNFNNRTELVIFIRPTVIRGSEDAQHVAEELRSRLWGLGASQAR
jgi:general secretion pathway protein D